MHFKIFWISLVINQPEWVDQGGRFYNRSKKVWLQDNLFNP